MDEIVKIKNLNHRYNGILVLKNIELAVRKGEVLTILGPNGSGKTTLLKCICKILKPVKGVVYIDGYSLNNLSLREVAKRVGYVPQRHEVTYPFTLLDFVLMGTAWSQSVFSRPSRKDIQKAKGILRELGIEKYIDRPYSNLSGGELQLALIARALMQNAKILVLDEPTAHLDFKNQIKVLSTIKKLVKSGRVECCITAMHDPNLASMFSDKIVLLSDGKIFAYGEPKDVLTYENLLKVYNIRLNIVNIDGKRIVLPMLEGGK